MQPQTNSATDEVQVNVGPVTLQSNLNVPDGAMGISPLRATQWQQPQPAQPLSLS
jgi:hypothetical protein